MVTFFGLNLPIFNSLQYLTGRSLEPQIELCYLLSFSKCLLRYHVDLDLLVYVNRQSIHLYSLVKVF